MTAPVLAFDTSGPWVALSLGPVTRVEERARGQAERLMPLAEETLAEAGLGWGDLAGIGVGTGPGNFTGLRVAVAAARGLALGLGVPSVGVDGFAATQAAHGTGGPVWLPATRGRGYLGGTGDGIRQLSEAERPEIALAPVSPAALVAAIARIAADRVASGAPIPRPAPVYVRPADAAPPSDPPPVILR